MSKASEYSEKRKAERPCVELGKVSGAWRQAGVNDNGELVIQCSACSIDIHSSEAIKLAHWILETFQ